MSWKGAPRAFPSFILWPLLYRDSTPLGTVSELSARYQASPAQEGLYLALVGALEGVLVTLAARYQREPADVLFALMMAHRTPLLREDATQEIAGRIKGLLQEMNAKEKRRSVGLEELRASLTHYHTLGKDEQLILRESIAQLSQSDQAYVDLFLEGLTAIEMGERLGKGDNACEKGLERALERLRKILTKKE